MNFDGNKIFEEQFKNFKDDPGYKWHKKYTFIYYNYEYLLYYNIIYIIIYFVKLHILIVKLLKIVTINCPLILELHCSYGPLMYIHKHFYI